MCSENDSELPSYFDNDNYYAIKSYKLPVDMAVESYYKRRKTN